MNKRIISALLAVVSLSISLGIQAASIDFTESNINAAPGSTIIMTVVGTGFVSDADSGAFGAIWNATVHGNVLSYVGTNVIDPPWDTEFINDANGATGTLDAVFLGSSSNAGTSFQVAEITFDVIGAAGTFTIVQLGIDEFNTGWFAPGAVPYPLVSYGSSTVTVSAVPIPASVWLFGSALGLLGWVRRRES